MFSFNKSNFSRLGALLILRSVMTFIYIYSFITYILIFLLDCKLKKKVEKKLKKIARFERVTSSIQIDRLVCSIKLIS